MFGCIDKRNPMCGIAQEHRPVDHCLEQPLRFALGDLLGQSTQLGDQLDQAHRLMDVQLVDHEDPAGMRVACNRLSNVVHKILLGAPRTDRGMLYLPTRYVKANDRTLGSVADVLEFPAFNQAWPHRLGGCLAFERLDGGQLVATDDVDPQRVQQWRIGVECANGFGLLGKCNRIRLGGVEPVAALMRFEIGLSLRSARPNGLRS